MRNQVKAKKHLGQHFLKDLNIAQRIADSLLTPPKQAIEVGPGMGVLTQFLVQREDLDFRVVEIDQESVEYLNRHYPFLKSRIIEGDFLKLNFKELFPDKFSIIGNFPYNISSQIFFKVFENRHQVESIVGMVQREVGQRLTSPHGSKSYGILSVFLQSFYTAEYLFTVDEDVFNPPPKVKSAVIRLTRNSVQELPCCEKLFIRVVKAAFNQRRKMLSNSLKSIAFDRTIMEGREVFNRRPEQMSVDDFQQLTLLIQQHPLCE